MILPQIPYIRYRTIRTSTEYASFKRKDGLITKGFLTGPQVCIKTRVQRGFCHFKNCSGELPLRFGKVGIKLKSCRKVKKSFALHEYLFLR